MSFCVHLTMAAEYDDITSFHYASYRPPLHLMILQQCLEEGDQFDLGLDIGCGTGQSALALKYFCQYVVGIDPSEEMLKKAFAGQDISYAKLDGNQLNFDHHSFDIITFAGSLFYAKSQLLLDELLKVLKDDGRIIIYDFEIILEPFLQQLGLQNIILENEIYNHQEDFSGLNQSNLIKHQQIQDTITLSIKPSQLAHLLLSAKVNYTPLTERYGQSNLHQNISSHLQNKKSSSLIDIQANIYYTIYAA